MPVYIYICEQGHECEIVESMLCADEHVCLICNTPMQRKPQAINVNWGGLRPSQGELSDPIKEMIDEAPRKRDEMVLHKSERAARLENAA